MTAPLNLQDLALERRPSTVSAVRRRQVPWLSRYVIPGGIVAGFLLLMAWALGDRLVTRTPVTIVPVIVTQAEARQAGTPLFQAAGWIEPRPTPVNAAALTEGVVESLLVVEGQSVRAGDPVARLYDADARLVLQNAQAALSLQAAELNSAEAELKAAQLRVDHPVHLDAQLADAESVLAKTRTELGRLPFLVEQTTARIDFAKSNLEGKRSAGGGISGRSLQQAESDYVSTDAELRELKERLPNLQLEEQALGKKLSALQEQRRLLIDENRQLETARAKVAAAQANRDQAKLRVDQAQLNLDRCLVRSPIYGRVMQLVAHPGMRVMGLESTAARSASTVVSLYNPAMLQVRADVRLENVPLVQPGQPVLVETASSKEPIHGTVLRATSSANIQKNTLEVKVALQNPPETVRPEMLVAATFLAPEVAEANTKADEKVERILVPRQLVETASGSPTIWIINSEGRADRRGIQLGQAGTDQLVEAIGLTPTDKLIVAGRESLKPGDLVTVTGEDQSLGLQMK